MSLKNIYNEVLQQDISNSLSLLLENDVDLLKFISDLDNQKLTEEEWEKFFKKIPKTKNYFAVACAILESENVPKHLAFKFAKTVPYDYQLLKRKDLNMDDIKEIVDIITPKRLKEIIANEFMPIYYKNIDLLCKLPESVLEELDYEPFTRVTEYNSWYLDIVSRLEKDDCSEKFCTAVINNTELNYTIRDKAFDIAYDPTNLRHITPNIASELYPELASIIFREKDFKDINSNYQQKINETFIKLINSEEFDYNHIFDLVERYKNHNNGILESTLCNIAETATEPRILENIQKAVPAARPSVVLNPAYDIVALDALGDNWIYSNSHTPEGKKVANYEKKIALMRAVFTTFLEKRSIKYNCNSLISENLEDDVLMKTLIMSPCADYSFRNFVLDTRKTEKDKLIYKCLAEIARKIEATSLNSVSRQFFAFHFLKELFNSDEKTIKSLPNRRRDKKYEKALTCEDFLTAHIETEKMSANFSHKEIAELGKIMKDISEKYPYRKEISNAFEKAYKTIQDEKFFKTYTTKWCQIFYTPTVKDRVYEFKMDTAIHMETLNSLKTQPTLMNMFSKNTIENCKMNKYFAEKLYKVFYIEFADYSTRSENTKTLLENFKLLAPLYHQIEEIVIENRFKDNEISENEYKMYHLKFTKNIDEKDNIER